MLALANQPNAIDMQKYFWRQSCHRAYVRQALILLLQLPKHLKKQIKNALSKGSKIEGMGHINHGIFQTGKQPNQVTRE